MFDLPLLSRQMVLRLLGLTAVGLLAACRPASAPGTGATPTSRSGAPGSTSARPSAAGASGTRPGTDPVVQRAADGERALLRAYDSALSLHPELAVRLNPLRAHHAAHLEALAPEASTASTAASERSGSGGSSASDLLVVTYGLAALERDAAAARLDDLATTRGSLAMVLASIGGCEAAHVSLLTAP